MRARKSSLGERGPAGSAGTARRRFRWSSLGALGLLVIAGGALAASRGHEASPEGGGPLAPTPGFFAPPAAWLASLPAPIAAPETVFPSSAAPPAQVRECTGQAPDRYYEFSFTRAIYNDAGSYFGRRGGRGSWSTDYPKADCQFIVVVKRLANLDLFYDSNAVALNDPQLRRFPFLYMLEVGRGGGMNLTDSEAQGLRDYLAAGGFLVVDDFWGTREWNAFERGIRQVLPNHPIVDIPLDHTLFRIFYTIEEVLQVPNLGNGQRVSQGFGATYEQDGYVPAVRGIYDENGRLMVVINWNTDLGDAWEWAENPFYPLRFSTFAFEMGVNMILYSMTH